MKRFPFVSAFLFMTIFSYAQKPMQSADAILAAATKQAGIENKNIIVIFHASWCGWCHKMDSSMNDISTRSFFNENYVTAHITVEESAKNKMLETPGGTELKKKYLGEQAGLPFWVVLDKKAVVLADSYLRTGGQSKDKPGDNIGCPASETEILAFIDILRKTSRMNDDQLQIIEARFKKNKAR